MHSRMKSPRSGRAQSLNLTAAATLCAALWCSASTAAPPVGPATQTAPSTQAQNPGAQTSPGGSNANGANLRRVAAVGIVAAGLWSVWRNQQTNQPQQIEHQTDTTSAPANLQAGIPRHTADDDRDRPIDMDGVNRAAELDRVKLRHLMDTLRDLRARKAYDCAHGRAAIDYFCAKIALVIEALDRHGVRDFGDQSHDACTCR